MSCLKGHPFFVPSNFPPVGEKILDLTLINEDLLIFINNHDLI